MPAIVCWPAVWPNEASGLSSCSTWAGIITTTCPIIWPSNAGIPISRLLVWGGEFGRTVYCQGKFTDSTYGRDHHPRNFSIWLAGGGIRPGLTWGETDDFSYNIVRDPVEVFDLNATILHLLGIDHRRLTWRYQGRDFRLTDVHGRVVEGWLA